MEVWVATTNKGKLDEIRNILSEAPIELHSLNELPSYSVPPETGKTFAENARIKAKALRAVKNEAWVLADDSGLEVAGLNNLPGVHSARYAGDNASDAENTAKLLKMMSLRSAQKREAKFKCALAVINPNGEEFLFEGILKGKIGLQQQGTNGFGYDSVFIPEGHEKTLAQMTPGEKNQISHRYQALKACISQAAGLTFTSI